MKQTKFSWKHKGNRTLVSVVCDKCDGLVGEVWAGAGFVAITYDAAPNVGFKKAPDGWLPDDDDPPFISWEHLRSHSIKEQTSRRWWYYENGSFWISRMRADEPHRFWGDDGFTDIISGVDTSPYGHDQPMADPLHVWCERHGGRSVSRDSVLQAIARERIKMKVQRLPTTDIPG